MRVEPRFASQRRRLCEEGCCVCLKSEGTNAKVISGFAKGCLSVLKSIDQMTLCCCRGGSFLPYHARCTTNHLTLTLIASHLTFHHHLHSFQCDPFTTRHNILLSEPPLHLSYLTHQAPIQRPISSPLLSSPQTSLPFTFSHRSTHRPRDNILMAACSETRLACKPYGLCYCFVIHLSHLGQEKRGQE